MTAPDSSLASPEGVAFVRRLGVNTIAQTAGLAGGTLLGFVTFLAVTRGLGPEAFGDLAAAAVFLLFPVALADLGLATGVLREISVAPERTEYVLRASLPLRFLASVALLGAALAVSLALPFTDRALTAIWLGSIGSFFTLMTLALQPLFQARLQMHVPVAAMLAGRALTLGLILVAFAADRRLRRGRPGIRRRRRPHSGCRCRRRGSPDLVSSRVRDGLLGDARASLARDRDRDGFFLSYYRIDIVLVALFRDSREAGLYGAAFRFVEIAEILVAATGVSVFPSFARLIATNDPPIAGALQRSLDVVLAVGAPILAGVLLVADELITFTAGAEFEPAASALRLLVPYLALLFLSGILIRLGAALHVDMYLLAVALAVLTLNVALNVVLLPVYGYTVAAVTSTASEACVVIALSAIVWRRLRFVPDVRHVWPVGLATAAMVTSYWLIPLPALVAVILASLVYGVVVIALPGTARDVVAAVAPGLLRPLRRAER